MYWAYSRQSWSISNRELKAGALARRRASTATPRISNRELKGVFKNFHEKKSRQLNGISNRELKVLLPDQHPDDLADRASQIEN